MVHYEGQGRGKKLVTAADLAKADIVLTTYSVLSHDIYLQPDVSDTREYNFRYAKRYQVWA